MDETRMVERVRLDRSDELGTGGDGRLGDTMLQLIYSKDGPRSNNGCSKKKKGENDTTLLSRFCGQVSRRVSKGTGCCQGRVNKMRQEEGEERRNEQTAQGTWRESWFDWMGGRLAAGAIGHSTVQCSAMQ